MAGLAAFAGLGALVFAGSGDSLASTSAPAVLPQPLLAAAATCFPRPGPLASVLPYAETFWPWFLLGSQLKLTTGAGLLDGFMPTVALSLGWAAATATGLAEATDVPLVSGASSLTAVKATVPPPTRAVVTSAVPATRPTARPVDAALAASEVSRLSSTSSSGALGSRLLPLHRQVRPRRYTFEVARSSRTCTKVRTAAPVPPRGV